jgi:subfamily B ATP-binding cassette protein MsbA
VNESYRLAAQRARVRGVFSGVAVFLGGVSVLLVLWYGGKLVLDKELSPGTLTSFILYTVTVSFALGALSELYRYIQLLLLLLLLFAL